MSYPIIMCEDNQIQLQQLDTLVENYILFHSDLFKVELTASKPQQVIDYLDQSEPQNGIYFLDIDLKAEIDGIQLAAIIRKKDVQAEIIFVTTHDELAPLTLKRKVAALDFIEKDQPLEDYRQEIYDTLDYAKQIIDETRTVQKKGFSFEVGSQVYNLDKSEVIFLEASDIPHRLNLDSTNGKFEFYGKLTELEKKYPFLFRISRSCLINPENIHHVDFSIREIGFSDGTTQKFSIGKSKKLKNIIQETL
ncbi:MULTISPECIES: response regulator transcription factor [Companilactobacillus]|uniref:LytTR family transcriptional regulator n=1 Tax=Companilactobacillus heilongjiangensis TaxID=1074467 RepID=A0A0K2LF53_9LACO|nr:response regulator transcription factor [Companilactobacillus heilongjiangensis]ALB29931.1 LytTR family transcriptional regulator [Companilactobacillus heilongjiangensis]